MFKPSSGGLASDKIRSAGYYSNVVGAELGWESDPADAGGDVLVGQLGELELRC